MQKWGTEIVCLCIGGIEGTKFSLWNFLTFSLQPAIIGESLIIFSHLKLTETCHFISFSFSCRWKTCQSKLLTHVGGVNKNYFYLDTMGKHNFSRSILNLKVFDIIIEYQVTMLQRICYSHWTNGARNGVISIGQWGVFNHEKGAIWQSHWAAQKEGVVTAIIFSNHKTS